MLILLISIQLERKRENREPLYTVLATFSSFWPRCADHPFQIWRSECAKVPGTNIEVQFSIPGTAKQGLDRGWLSRDTNLQIGIYGSFELARNISKIGSSSL